MLTMADVEKGLENANPQENSKNMSEIQICETKAESTSTKRASYADRSSSRGWSGWSSFRSRRLSNMFAARKTVAQGMMDIALITANANQLRYLLDYAKESQTFYIVLILIIISLILQVMVGILLIFKGRFDRGQKPESRQCLKNCIVLGIFLITIINIFIAAFNGPAAIKTI